MAQARRAGRDRRGARHRRGDPEPERPAPHHALGQLEVLSTHDQVLGGPSGQSYLGCRFPADPAYAAVITRDAVKVGQELVGEGVLGRFAFDFVVVRNGAAWTPVRDRAEPPEGRDDPPVPHAPVPDRRAVRPRVGDVHAAQRPAEVLRRDRPSRVGAVPRPPAAGRLRHHGAPRAPLQPDEADRRRAPHADGAVGARPSGAHRGRRDAGGGRRDLPAGRRRRWTARRRRRPLRQDPGRRS